MIEQALAVLIVAIAGAVTAWAQGRRTRRELERNLERLPASLDVLHAQVGELVASSPDVQKRRESLPPPVYLDERETAPGTRRRRGESRYRVNTPPPVPGLLWPYKPGPKREP